MARDSIVDDAERTRRQTADESDPADENDSATETGNDRKRVTQRIPPDLIADIDTVQEEYALPSRNAAINFILKQGTNNLLNGGD